MTAGTRSGKGTASVTTAQPASEPTASPEALHAAADRLIEAHRTRTPCRPVRELLPGAGVATAYAVQELVNSAREAAGARRVGRKVGLTGLAIQTQLGVDEPDFGVLFADMSREQDEVVDTSVLLQPRIEAEVAVLLATDLDGPIDELTPERVRSAVEVAIPAFEIVASRVAGWDITLLDTVADNASAGMFVLGDERLPLDEVDLRAIRMRMTDDTGAEVATGRGTDCMGDPMASLAWLARTVAGLGEPLRAGEVVLTGALGPMVPVTAGRGYAATLDGLGSVRIRFGDAT